LGGGYSVLASCHFIIFSIEILKEEKEYLQLEATSQKSFWFNYIKIQLLMPIQTSVMCMCVLFHCKTGFFVSQHSVDG
jgi:hypothetical protein